VPADLPQPPVPDDADDAVRRSDEARAGAGVHSGVLERRRASRSLWAACEALLGGSADPRALQRAIHSLRAAFDCDAVALHALGGGGVIEPWIACGTWRSAPGDLRDCVSVPLFRGSERVGTLDLKARPGRRWHPAQLGLVRTAAGALGAAVGARIELERLRSQPGRDPVTGLPDARGFQTRLGEELSRARRHGLPLGVLLVDIDHFAALGERYGHEVAHAVLAEAALLLRLLVRDSDVLARLPGDHFAVILPETDASAAQRCAERLRRALEEHRFARVGRVSASAAAASGPRDGMEPLELMSQLDQAISVARKSGRRRVAVPDLPHTH
jgi:diguanylate cyclase (GGDEF)-like protein